MIIKVGRRLDCYRGLVSLPSDPASLGLLFSKGRSPCILALNDQFMNIPGILRLNELRSKNAPLYLDEIRKMVALNQDLFFEAFPSYEPPFGPFRTKQKDAFPRL